MAAHQPYYPPHPSDYYANQSQQHSYYDQGSMRPHSQASYDYPPQPSYSNLPSSSGFGHPSTAYASPQSSGFRGVLIDPRDPNAQLWAEYYSKGGTDPTGLVYFIPETLHGWQPGPHYPSDPNVSQASHPQQYSLPAQPGYHDRVPSNSYQHHGFQQPPSRHAPSTSFNSNPHPYHTRRSSSVDARLTQPSPNPPAPNLPYGHPPSLPPSNSASWAPNPSPSPSHYIQQPLPPSNHVSNNSPHGGPPPTQRGRSFTAMAPPFSSLARSVSPNHRMSSSTSSPLPLHSPSSFTPSNSLGDSGYFSQATSMPSRNSTTFMGSLGSVGSVGSRNTVSSQSPNGRSLPAPGPQTGSPGPVAPSSSTTSSVPAHGSHSNAFNPEQAFAAVRAKQGFGPGRQLPPVRSTTLPSPIPPPLNGGGSDLPTPGAIAEGGRPLPAPGPLFMSDKAKGKLKEEEPAELPAHFRPPLPPIPIASLPSQSEDRASEPLSPITQRPPQLTPEERAAAHKAEAQRRMQEKLEQLRNLRRKTVTATAASPKQDHSDVGRNGPLDEGNGIPIVETTHEDEGRAIGQAFLENADASIESISQEDIPTESAGELRSSVAPSNTALPPLSMFKRPLPPRVTSKTTSPSRLLSHSSGPLDGSPSPTGVPEAFQPEPFEYPPKPETSYNKAALNPSAPALPLGAARASAFNRRPLPPPTVPPAVTSGPKLSSPPRFSTSLPGSDNEDDPPTAPSPQSSPHSKVFTSTSSTTATSERSSSDPDSEISSPPSLTVKGETGNEMGIPTDPEEEQHVAGGDDGSESDEPSAPPPRGPETPRQPRVSMALRMALEEERDEAIRHSASPPSRPSTANRNSIAAATLPQDVGTPVTSARPRPVSAGPTPRSTPLPAPVSPQALTQATIPAKGQGQAAPAPAPVSKSPPVTTPAVPYPAAVPRRNAPTPVKTSTPSQTRRSSLPSPTSVRPPQMSASVQNLGAAQRRLPTAPASSSTRPPVLPRNTPASTSGPRQHPTVPPATAPIRASVPPKTSTTPATSTAPAQSRPSPQTKVNSSLSGPAAAQAPPRTSGIDLDEKPPEPILRSPSPVRPSPPIAINRPPPAPVPNAEQQKPSRPLPQPIPLVKKPSLIQRKPPPTDDYVIPSSRSLPSRPPLPSVPSTGSTNSAGRSPIPPISTSVPRPPIRSQPSSANSTRPPPPVINLPDEEPDSPQRNGSKPVVPSVSISTAPSITVSVSEEPSSPTKTNGYKSPINGTTSTARSFGTPGPKATPRGVTPAKTNGSAAPAAYRKGSLRCAGCDKLIVGRIVSAMDQRWHPACFKCTQCGELLEHVSSYEHGGKPYCHLDYHELFAPHCFHCETSIADERFITVTDPGLSNGETRYYHELHFFCAECGDPFLHPSASSAAPKAQKPRPHEDPANDLGYTVYQGHPYCEACHVRLRMPKCAGCKKSIRDEVVEALDQKWHFECFCCSACKKPFEDPSFFQRGEKAYCDQCYRVLLRNEI